jgi:2-polyprenyl-6-methoxyphenol hydroxylase-like FAD-dependent oxidoreductase
MPNTLAKHAVVIGAGMGGLAAAKAVAPHFEKVFVLDRDALPEEPAARAGTPQARHAHALLAGGQKALESLFPGIKRDLAKAGAVAVRGGRDIILDGPGPEPLPRRDLGFDLLCMSRALIECVCRRRLAEEPNIELRSRSRVTELVSSPDHRRVAGVRFEQNQGESQTLTADLVVDASGRGAPTLSLLEKTGSPKPDQSEIEINIEYATGIFEIPPDPPAEWMGVGLFPIPPHMRRGGLILPMEGGRWIVSLSGRHGEPPPGDLEGFIAFTRTLRKPTIYQAIRTAKPVGDIVRYNFPASVWRHFDRTDRFPRGLVPLGDSVCRFNPVFGQGMSVAAIEAVALGRLLGSRTARSDPLDDLAAEYLVGTRECLEAPWATAITDFVYPQTRGERPPDFDKRLQYGAALTRLAAEDAEAHKLLFEVSNLLKPHSALREPELANRVMALMAAA